MEDVMKNKIREYVYYQLRFDEDKGNEELKEEIISNINDRYDEIFEKTKDDNIAYIRAIKTMGDFTEGKNLESAKSAYKPSIPEMFLIAGVILAIFGVIIVFFSNIAGGIITMLSIVSFSVGSNYIYQESQYIKNVEFDIEKHNDYLTKIFSYMKTCFVFWAIGISYLLAAIVNGIITSISIIDSVGTLDLDTFRMIFILSIVVFVVVFIILLAIFKNVYDRLISKYYELTGNIDINSKIRDAQNFIGLNKSEKKDTNILTKVWFYPSITSLAIIIMLFSRVGAGVTHLNIRLSGILLSTFGWLDQNSELSLLILVLLIPMIVVIILIILQVTQKIKNRFIVPISFIILTLIHIIVASSSYSRIYIYNDSASISFIASFILVILVVIDLITNSLKK
jgi:hypothetical protein